MEPKEVAELQADKTFDGFIKYSKAAVYWILAILIILAWANFGADGSGSKYNGEVYAPMNTSKWGKHAGEEEKD